MATSTKAKVIRYSAGLRESVRKKRLEKTVDLFSSSSVTDYSNFMIQDYYMHSMNTDKYNEISIKMSRDIKSDFNEVREELTKTVLKSIDQLIDALKPTEQQAKDTIKEVLFPNDSTVSSKDKYSLIVAINREFGKHSTERNTREVYQQLENAYNVIYGIAREYIDGEYKTVRRTAVKKGITLENSIMYILESLRGTNIPASTYTNSLNALLSLAQALKNDLDIPDSLLHGTSAKAALGIISELPLLVAFSDINSQFANNKLAGFSDTKQYDDLLDNKMVDPKLESKTAETVLYNLNSILKNTTNNAADFKTVDYYIEVNPYIVNPINIGFDVKSGFSGEYPLNFQTTVDKVFKVLENEANMRKTTLYKTEYIISNAISLTDSTGLYYFKKQAGDEFVQMLITAIMATQHPNWWLNKFYTNVDVVYPLFISIGGEFTFFTTALEQIREQIVKGSLDLKRNAFGISKTKEFSNTRDRLHSSTLRTLKRAGQFNYTAKSFDALNDSSTVLNYRNELKDKVRNSTISFYTRVNIKPY